MPPTLASDWISDDKEFIEILKNFEEINAFGKDYSQDNPVWQDISAKTKLTPVYCRKKWLAIKHTYLKLKHMIRIGRVTEDRVRTNQRTSRYVDGRLNFLDRFLSEIPDTALPNSVHYFFASLFGDETDISTHNVDAVKLIKLNKKGSVIQVIQDYDQETGTEPTCILPNTEQAIEEEYKNDEDSNGVELVVPTPVHQVTLPPMQLDQDDPVGDMANFQYVTSSSIQPATNDPIGDMTNFQYITTSNIQPKKTVPIGDNAKVQYRIIQSKKNEEPEEPDLKRKKRKYEDNCNLAHFLVKYTNTNIETENTGDLKEYMDDLAEVLCNRLAPNKRKYFLSQIDLIVSEMLEG